MAQYHRLSLVEHEELSRMSGAGNCLRAIGQALSRAPSTLSVKLTRHQAFPVTSTGDRAPTDPALGTPVPQASEARGSAPLLRTAVFSLLAQRWSPKQIARGLPQHPHEPTMWISREAIYMYLYVLPRGMFKRELARYLHLRHRFRRPRKVRLSSRPIQGTSSVSTSGP